MEILILENVWKLFTIEENFDLLFKDHIVQKDWLFWTINHLEKFEKAEPWRKLKELCKLSNNKTLYFKCLERFESCFEFFSFKFNFLEFCNNFVPDFENLYYLLHLNTSDSNKESRNENSESKQDCSKNASKNACLEIGNGTSKVRNNENIERERNEKVNRSVLLENRLRGDFVGKNVVNLPKRNLNGGRFIYCQKD